MERIGRVDGDPAAVAAGDHEVVVGSSGLGDVGSVVLATAPVDPAIRLGHLQVVVHGRGQVVAAVLPGLAAVGAPVQAAVVRGVDKPRPRRRHDVPMLIGMGVLGVAPVPPPVGDPLPALPAIDGAVDVDAAADDMIGVGRVHGNGVVVEHLPLVGEVGAGDIGPAIAAIPRTVDAEDAALPVGELGIEHRSVGRRDGEGSATQYRRVRQSG